MALAMFLLLTITVFGWQKQFAINTELKSENKCLMEKVEKLFSQQDTTNAKLKRLEETHPYLGKRWKSKRTGECVTGNFFGFMLYTPVDTSVSKELIYALSSYKGPTARVNSLKRGYNKKSQHFHGRAVDLEWNEDVISFLVSKEGVE